MIRKLGQDDIATILAIEQENPSPWTEPMVQGEFFLESARPYVIVTDSGSVVGWCCCRVIEPEAELLKIAVKKQFRRRGLASKLLETLVAKLADCRVERVFLEVRAENGPALSFYEKHGFVQAGRRSCYYSNPTDDAVIMVRDISFDHDRTGAEWSQ